MKFNRVVCRIFSAVMLCILAFLSFISLLSTTYISDNETVFYVSDRPYVHFFVLLILLACLYLAKTKWKLNEKINKKFIFGLGIVISVLLTIYVLAAMFYPRFDQRQVVYIAAQMLWGDYTEFQPGGYAEIYPHQNGILLFYEILTFIFGANNGVAIQMVNLIFIVASFAALYFMFKLLTEKYLYTTAAVMLFLPLWGFVSFIYGNVPGFSFGMWALYFALKYLQDKKWSAMIVGSVCMALSCVMKMNFMVLLITIIGIAFMETVKKKDFHYLLMAVVMTVFVLAGDKGVDMLVHEQTGLEETGGIPGVAYIAMGLHEQIYRGAGWYDNYSENIYEEYNHNTEIVKDVAVDDIEASIDSFKRHPQYMVGFFIRKVASMWNEPSYDSLSMQMERDSLHQATPEWVSMLVDKGKVNSGVYQIMNLMQSLIMIGAFAYFALHFKNEDFTKNVFALFFLGGFLLHLLWEASSQYAIFYVMLLVPYAVVGYLDFLRKLAGAKKRDILAGLFIAAIFIAIISIPQLTEFLTLNRSDALYLEYLSQ